MNSARPTPRWVAFVLAAALFLPAPALALRVQNPGDNAGLEEDLHTALTPRGGLEEGAYSRDQILALADIFSKLPSLGKRRLRVRIEDPFRAQHKWAAWARRRPLDDRVQAQVPTVLEQFQIAAEIYDPLAWTPEERISAMQHIRHILAPRRSGVPQSLQMLGEIWNRLRAQTSPGLSEYVQIAELVLQVVDEGGGEALTSAHIDELARWLPQGLGLARTRSQRLQAKTIRGALHDLRGLQSASRRRQISAPRASRDGRVVSGHGESRAPARESPSTEASGLEEPRKPPKPLEAYREEFDVGRELLARPYKLGGGGSGVVATVRSRDGSIFSGFIPRSLASGYANNLGKLVSTREMIPVRVIESQVDRQGGRLLLKFRVWDRTIQERLERLGTIREGMELTVKNVRRDTEGIARGIF